METIYNWTIMKNNTVFGYAQGSREEKVFKRITL